MNINKPIILFDGVCNFCNGLVNFIIRQDKKNIFLFAPLQSERGKKLLDQYGIDWKNNDSFVVIENAGSNDPVRQGKAYEKSNAALRIAAKLPWYWKWSQVFWILPKPIRDWAYNIIAKNRYKWFGKKEECMIPTEQVRGKFLL